MALPTTAFIDPTGSNRAEVEAFLEEALAMILDLASTAQSRSPLPSARFIPHALIPETALAQDDLLNQLRTLLEHSMNPAHKGWLAHMDPQPSVASLVADLAAASVNNNMLSLEMSPVFSRLEVQLLKAIAQRFGLGEQAGGVMTSGGSLANLQALAVARNLKLGCADEGLSASGKRPVLFCSEAAHSSVQKAATLLGLGRRAVHKVKTVNSKLDVADLGRAYAHALERGEDPFCVVATAGTTTTGNLDPLPDIADFCKANTLWFHVDAAYGGALVFSPIHKHLLAGIEGADSLTFNPQKWLYVAKTSALILFKDKAVLTTQFRTAAPYMGQAEDFINLGEISVQGTRHADVLKLWLTLQHLGAAGCAELIDQSVKLTAYLADRLSRRDELVLASEPETNIVCFRIVVPGLAAAQLDRLNADLQRHLLSEQAIFLSLATYRGCKWLRVVILNPHTSESELDKLLKGIDTFLSEMDALH